MKLLTNISGALLLAMALSLFLVNWISPSYIQLPRDPVLAVSLRSLFWIFGGLALAVSLICLFDDLPTRQMFSIACLATVFNAYQIGVYCVGSRGLSGYLGGFSRAFGMSAYCAGALATFVFAYLLIMSYGSLAWLGRFRKLEANFLKMSCPSCGGHIKFAVISLGGQISCPHCQTAVTLRKPEENLKISCFFCKEHIEFPPHALGTKIPCPHCKKHITLQQTGVPA
jgi:hypothetical protein